MRRYFFESSIGLNSDLKIDGELFKHIFKVCRRKEGDHFELLSDGEAYLVEVSKVLKNEALVRVLEKRKLNELKKPHIHLVLANPKPAVFERVLEKSVELGVKSIRLIISENSFFKSIDKLKLKEKRALKITKQAMQQSGRGESLTLEEPKTLKDFLEDFKSMKDTEGVFFYEAESADFSVSSINLDKSALSCHLLIGGEGGFTEAEAALVRSSGFKSISLGEQILRVETACVAGVSILKFVSRTW